MRANNQKPYVPKEGKMISDINKSWELLEKAEHERELALKEELIRLTPSRRPFLLSSILNYHSCIIAN